MKLKLLALALLAFSTISYSQQKMIVFLDEKTDQEVQKTDFTARSLERRSNRSIEFDEKDKPVNPEYIIQLRTDGKILNTSRWLNAVTFETELSMDELQTKYAFITRIKSVGKGKPSENSKFETGTKALDYGQGTAQVTQINLQCLHNLGYTGSGIYLGIIDAGFSNMDGIIYFDTVYNENRVIDVHNFVTGSSQVYNSSGHGTSVASCIVGEKGTPDSFAGTAIDVDLALYLAEDVGSETEIEEFNVVAALERCDSVGVDVVNISLGYFEFDDAQTSHVYADLDGNTTIAAMGVNVAASKGIAVVMSAGNSGPSYISTPCDSDDGLCIGAVDFFGDIAGFSSVGPNADSQVKPDVAARGQDTWFVDAGSGDLVTGNGTSFSSPIMAGATACLIQAHPTKTVAEIFDAIRQSASQFTTPDEFKGYGIPDLCAAHDLLEGVGLEEVEEQELLVFPNPAKDLIVVELMNANDQTEVLLLNALGEVVDETSTNEFLEKAVFKVQHLSNGVYTIQVRNENSIQHAKVMISH